MSDGYKTKIKLEIHCSPENEEKAVEILAQFNLPQIWRQEAYTAIDAINQETGIDKIIILTVVTINELTAKEISRVLYENNIIPERQKRIWMSTIQTKNL